MPYVVVWKSFPALVAVGVALFGLSACNSQKPAATAPETAGQVIAKVGGEDVTVHELQNEYRRVGVAPDKVTEDITRAVLAELVKRKSLAQRAKAAGLDREPTVLLDLLRTREQVLATALLQRDIQTKVSTIGKAEVDRYMLANPERFGKRVRFDVDQLTVNAVALTQEFADSVKDATALDAIETKIIAANLPYTRGAGALFSGELPSELVARLRDRKDSDVFFVRNANVGTFFKVKAEAADPLAGDAAQQRAQGLLRNETAQAEATRPATAEISYMGEYAKLMEKAVPAGAAPAGAAPAGDTPKTEAPKTEAPKN